MGLFGSISKAVGSLASKVIDSGASAVKETAKVALDQVKDVATKVLPSAGEVLSAAARGDVNGALKAGADALKVAGKVALMDALPGGPVTGALAGNLLDTVVDKVRGGVADTVTKMVSSPPGAIKSAAVAAGMKPDTFDGIASTMSKIGKNLADEAVAGSPLAKVVEALYESLPENAPGAKPMSIDPAPHGIEMKLVERQFPVGSTTRYKMTLQQAICNNDAGGSAFDTSDTTAIAVSDEHDTSDVAAVIGVVANNTSINAFANDDLLPCDETDDVPDELRLNAEVTPPLALVGPNGRRAAPPPEATAKAFYNACERANVGAMGSSFVIGDDLNIGGVKHYGPAWVADCHELNKGRSHEASASTLIIRGRFPWTALSPAADGTAKVMIMVVSAPEKENNSFSIGGGGQWTDPGRLRYRKEHTLTFVTPPKNKEKNSGGHYLLARTVLAEARIPDDAARVAFAHESSATAYVPPITAHSSDGHALETGSVSASTVGDGVADVTTTLSSDLESHPRQSRATFDPPVAWIDVNVVCNIPPGESAHMIVIPKPAVLTNELAGSSGWMIAATQTVQYDSSRTGGSTTTAALSNLLVGAGPKSFNAWGAYPAAGGIVMEDAFDDNATPRLPWIIGLRGINTTLRHSPGHHIDAPTLVASTDPVSYFNRTREQGGWNWYAGVYPGEFKAVQWDGSTRIDPEYTLRGTVAYNSDGATDVTAQMPVTINGRETWRPTTAANAPAATHDAISTTTVAHNGTEDVEDHGSSTIGTIGAKLKAAGPAVKIAEDYLAQIGVDIGNPMQFLTQPYSTANFNGISKEDMVRRMIGACSFFGSEVLKGARV